MTPGVTVNHSIEEKINEFRSDPEKMYATTKFVNDLVEKAKDEALKRMKEREKERQRVLKMTFDGGSSRKRGRWHSRARGFFSRLFASLCFCSTETQV